MTNLINADALLAQMKEYYEKRAEEANMTGDRAICVTWHDAVILIKSAPTVDAVPKWIPCSERLPDDDRTKVVTLANGNAEAGYYSNGDWWCIGDSISLENPTVIAWMPLPEPYEVDE